MGSESKFVRWFGLDKEDMPLGRIAPMHLHRWVGNVERACSAQCFYTLVLFQTTLLVLALSWLYLGRVCQRVLVGRLLTSVGGNYYRPQQVGCTGIDALWVALSTNNRRAGYWLWPLLTPPCQVDSSRTVGSRLSKVVTDSYWEGLPGQQGRTTIVIAAG